MIAVLRSVLNGDLCALVGQKDEGFAEWPDQFSGLVGWVTVGSFPLFCSNLGICRDLYNKNHTLWHYMRTAGERS